MNTPSRISAIVDSLQQARTMPRQVGPGTARQQQVSDLVNERVTAVRPDLPTAHMPPAEAVTQLQGSVLRSRDTREAGRINATFLRMTDGELGKAVRQAERIFGLYVNEHAGTSAGLLHLGLLAFQAAAVGVMRGDPASAQRAIAQEHERFDRALYLAVNGEVAIVKAEAEQFVEQQRSDLAVLAEENARALADERADNELALAAAETSLVEASNAQREADALTKKNKDLLRQLSKLEYDSGKQLRQLSGQLTGLPALEEERDELQTQVHRLNAHLSAERNQFVIRERALKTRIAELETEVLDMKTRPAAAVSPSVRPAPLRIALAQHSWVLWLRSKGYAAVLDGLHVRHNVTASEIDALTAQWHQDVPDEATALQPIRQVILSVLGRAA